MARRVKPKQAKKLEENLFESEASFDAFGDKAQINLEGNTHDVQQLASASKTHLEDDRGEGAAFVVRCFEFGMNLEAFKQYQPTKQELFNSHYKGIEVALWKDGLQVFPDTNPRIVIDAENARYKIFVGAKPMRGHILNQNPQTLTEIAHGGK